MATARVRDPETRKAGAATAPTLTNYLNSNSDPVTTALIFRLQRLRSFSLVGARAGVIANLAWRIA